VATSNPDWTRDELVLALDVYLQHRPHIPGQDSRVIENLSADLQRLGAVLFAPEQRAATFRNPPGVYMKLMNFRRLDPAYLAEGKKGLTAGANADEEVWDAFAADPAGCHGAAAAIRQALASSSETLTAADSPDDQQDAPEGKLLTRLHVNRERNGQLVARKRKQTLAKQGHLACEVCGFDFAARYGTRGAGFIECHHLTPLATLAAGSRTRLDDLALVCFNCHRMIHRSSPWLTIEELRETWRLHA
jgi:5-methylcytosine-specific restriction protein A